MTHSPTPPSCLWNHFFGFQLRLQNWTPFKTPKSSQNRPKSSQNPAPDPSKTAPKRRLMLQPPKIKNNATLPRFCSFLTFPGLAKSSQNRCQNGFKICVFLETLLEAQKTRFCKLKSSQNGPQNFQNFPKSF